MKSPAKSFNTLARKFGLEQFNNFIEVLEGDHTLLADIPEWVGFSEIRPNLHYIGPLAVVQNNFCPFCRFLPHIFGCSLWLKSLPDLRNIWT